MSRSRNQHAHNGDWAVRGEGNSRVTSTHGTQREAIEAAREIAINRTGEVVIHRPNGQIRDKDSHGHDPFPPEAETGLRQAPSLRWPQGQRTLPQMFERNWDRRLGR